jgi:ribosomal protein S18 acetylase RimI-like enzyme
MVTWVRPLAREDLPAVLAIENEANPSPWRLPDFAGFLTDLPDSHLAGEAPGGEAPVGETPGGVKSGGERKAWVFADPEVRGFLCALGVAGEAELQSVAVEKARWGRGAGSALMQALFAWARAGRYGTLHLEVREGNARAREFYARWGFMEVGRRPRYYQDNGEAAVLMSLKLPFPSP